MARPSRVEAGVPDRVDAAVHAMKRSVADPHSDSDAPEPVVAQLGDRDLTLLLGRPPRDAHVGGEASADRCGDVDGSTRLSSASRLPPCVYGTARVCDN